MTPDVPSRGDDVNQEGREVPASLPRVDFFHWLLLDIPAATTEIAAGAQSDGVTPRGKSGPAAPGGLRHGINDYTGWFAGDEQMKGDYFGYDGPLPSVERQHSPPLHLHRLCAGHAHAGGLRRADRRQCARGAASRPGAGQGQHHRPVQPEPCGLAA